MYIVDTYISLLLLYHLFNFHFRFQELDLSAEALVVKDLARETEWIDSITAALKEVGKYKRIHSVRLVGMLLVVFVEQSVARFVTEVDSDEIATGIMGIMVSSLHGYSSLTMSIFSQQRVVSEYWKFIEPLMYPPDLCTWGMYCKWFFDVM